MCGRFLLIAPAEALRRRFGAAGSPNLAARYNIAPTQSTAVVRVTPDGGRELASLRWGLIPSWAKDAMTGAGLINARADTLAVKPSFRAAYRQRRCLVPADGFYEWQVPASGKGPKQPFLIARADRATFAFAGLWEQWRDRSQTIESFAIVTTDANAALKAIHHRMPAILEPSDCAAWLDPENRRAGELLRPAPDAALIATPISTRVNSVANDDPGIVEPVSVAAAIPAAPAPKPRPAKNKNKPDDPHPAQGSLF